MNLNPNWHEAIQKRTSRRSYTGDPLTPSQLEKLRNLLSDINSSGFVNFRLIEDGSQFFNGLTKSYGMFKNVRTVIALVGDKNAPQIKKNIGYFGEFLVLEAVHCGLGTCWIGGTYDRKSLASSLNLTSDEELFAVLAIGPVPEDKTLKEKLLSGVGKNKPTWEQLLESPCAVPDWVRQGLVSARLAPSGMNKKPSRYQFQDGTLRAYVINEKYGSELTDLGISLAHFELGAHQAGITGNWEPDGDGFVFTISPEIP